MGHFDTRYTVPHILAISTLFFGFSTSGMAQENPAALDTMLAESHQTVAQAAPADSALGEALQTAQTGLPNGASSITETYSDWTVNCAVQEGQRRCAMSQAQGNSQTGQQIFGVELYGTSNGTSNGILVLPFGLDIQTPVTLAIGDEPLGSEAPFTTCMPGGCVVPVSFTVAELDALRRGTTASVTARGASGDAEPAQFTISLAGFTAAVNRIDQLAR